MRLLLDTNVLVDYYLVRAPFAADAARVFAAGRLGDVELWASAKSFTDAFYVGRKALGSERMQRVMAASLGTLHACSIDHEDVVTCLALLWSDFEDCLVARAAEKVRADLLITRDLSGFERAKVQIASPGEALARIKAETGRDYAALDQRMLGLA